MYLSSKGVEHSVKHYEVLVHFSILPDNPGVSVRQRRGGTIYVGRAFHDGALLPAKVIPDTSDRHTHVSYDGREFPKQDFEILAGYGVSWKKDRNGNVPLEAIPGGYTKTGEILYIGRANHAGSLIVGRIHPSHCCLYLCDSWKEHSYKEYEVLVEDRGQVSWVPASYGRVPPGAVFGGRESSHDFYIGRAPFNDSLIGGKVRQKFIENCLVLIFFVGVSEI